MAQASTQVIENGASARFQGYSTHFKPSKKEREVFALPRCCGRVGAPAATSFVSLLGALDPRTPARGARNPPKTRRSGCRRPPDRRRYSWRSAARRRSSSLSLSAPRSGTPPEKSAKNIKKRWENDENGWKTDGKRPRCDPFGVVFSIAYGRLGDFGDRSHGDLVPQERLHAFGRQSLPEIPEEALRGSKGTSTELYKALSIYLCSILDL